MFPVSKDPWLLTCQTSGCNVSGRQQNRVVNRLIDNSRGKLERNEESVHHCLALSPA